jgi:EAL domain-containing protein (putative c-di-GMP-specific phosphodiesterase class I)
MLGAPREPIVIDGFTLEVGASIGAAFCPEHGLDFVPLLERADVAMHQTKTGGGGFAVYSPEQDPTSPDRLALMGDLRQAILAGEMVLHYQPKVSLTTGQVVAAEALVRWEHPARGLLAPVRFIGLAEQTGLIKPLTYWVVGEALREAVAWRRAGFDVPVAVNLSAKNLLDPALAERIAKLLDGADGAAGALALELTESAIMADPAQARQQLARLNRMGIRLAVDDFGTGYSSLAYLKQLPVQELKIDKVFVQGLMKDRHDAALVRASIDLGHTLGLTVVAEGAEDRQTWHGLVAVGCDAVQGYVVTKPLPSADFLAWLKARGGAAEPAGFE